MLAEKLVDIDADIIVRKTWRFAYGDVPGVPSRGCCAILYMQMEESPYGARMLVLELFERTRLLSDYALPQLLLLFYSHSGYLFAESPGKVHPASNIFHSSTLR